MTSFRTRRPSASLGFTALLGTALALVCATTVHAQVVSDPRIAEFDPSPDHWAVLDDGQSAVVRYELGVYMAGAAAPFTTVDMGKPSPASDGKIRYDFSSGVGGWPLPGGAYEARVSAIGPEGEALSDPSNPFTFSTAATRTTPVIDWATPAAITYGTALSGIQLNATASVAGTFVYSPAAGTVLTAGTYTLSATFTPADTTLYTTATAYTSLTVNAVTRTTPTITWAAPAAITYGTALSSIQLNATASVAGTFVYSPAAGTVLTAGTYTLTATFTPADATLYTTATAYTSLTVNAVTRTTPTITWATPTAITYGTALSSTQLNATASVAGTIVYSPAAGTVLSAGTQTLTAAFTPTDTTRYNSTSATRSLTVNSVVYRLTVTRPTGGTVQGAGINCGTSATLCQVTMPSSMSLGLQAVADSGYSFSGWTGDCSGTSASFTLALTGAKTCGATFTTVTTSTSGGASGRSSGTTSGGTSTSTSGALTYGAPYRLTITRGSGGTVRSAGINCGTTAKACQVEMPAPMTLGLQATPDAGYTFTGWSGDCSGSNASFWLALEGPRTCAATFVATSSSGSSGTTTPAPTTPTTTTSGDSLPMGPPYTLTVTRPSGGTIRSAGVNCGDSASNCSVTMPGPMRLGLQATPDRGYVFSGWTGNCSGTSVNLWLALEGPRTCGATFTKRN